MNSDEKCIEVRFMKNAVFFATSKLAVIICLGIFLGACSHYGTRNPASSSISVECSGLARALFLGYREQFSGATTNRAYVVILKGTEEARNIFFSDISDKIKLTPHNVEVLKGYASWLNFGINMELIKGKDANAMAKKLDMPAFATGYSLRGDMEVIWRANLEARKRIGNLKSTFEKRIEIFGEERVRDFIAAVDSIDFTLGKDDFEALQSGLEMVAREIHESSDPGELDLFTSYLRFISLQTDADFITGVKDMGRLLGPESDRSRLMKEFFDIQNSKKLQKNKYYREFYGNFHKKGMDELDASKKADGEASQAANRYEKIRMACTTKRKTEAKIWASRVYRGSLLGLGIAYSGGSAIAQRSGDENSPPWYKVLGHELSLTFSYVLMNSRINQGATGVAIKTVMGSFGSGDTQLSTAQVLAAISGTTIDVAQGKLSAANRSADTMKAKADLTAYIEKNLIADKYKQKLGEVATVSAKTMDAKNSNELASKAFNDLVTNFSSTLAKSPEGTVEKTMSMDPKTFDQWWLLSAAPRGYGVYWLGTRLLCFTPQRPYMGVAAIISLIVADQVLFDALYKSNKEFYTE
jgi:hypothetical protein